MFRFAELLELLLNLVELALALANHTACCGCPAVEPGLIHAALAAAGV